MYLYDIILYSWYGCFTCNLYDWKRDELIKNLSENFMYLNEVTVR